MAQQTINIGAAANDNTGDSIRDGGDKINDNFTELYLNTGWEEYEDSTDTVGSPQVVTAGNTANLTNDGVTATRNDQSPLTSGAFFDVSTAALTPELEGDFYAVDLMFKVKNSIQSGVFEVYVDIGGIGGRFLQTRICPKIADTETGINISFNHFVSSQFATNGGVIKITAITGTTSIYDKQFRICRIHRAK